MRKKSLLVLLGTLIVNTVFASGSTENVIYKWQGSDGMIHYTHIRPDEVESYEQLDSSGRRVEDYTKDFGEIVEIVMKQEVKADENMADTKSLKEPTDEEVQLEANRKKEVKEKNCATAQNNLSTLSTGEVYERDSDGNMVRLDGKQIESKRQDVLREIQRYCSSNQEQ